MGCACSRASAAVEPVDSGKSAAGANASASSTVGAVGGLASPAVGIVKADAEVDRGSNGSTPSHSLVPLLPGAVATPKDDIAGDGAIAEEFEAGQVRVRGCACLDHIGAGDPPLKSEQQDVAVCQMGFGGVGTVGFFGIFDGHGQTGRACSTFAAASVESRLKGSIKSLSSGDNGNAEAELIQVFRRVHLEMESGVDAVFSGTTATVGLLLGADLWVAWCGDSRALLVRDADDFTALSGDHRPDDPVEAARVEEEGGRVCQNRLGIGPLRVWHPEEDVPGLMVTRTLGDVFSHDFGVSSTPAVHHIRLGSRCRYLVLGSDGVWDVLSNSDVADIVMLSVSPESACDAIVQSALSEWESRGSADNISVVVVELERGEPQQ